MGGKVGVSITVIMNSVRVVPLLLPIRPEEAIMAFGINRHSSLLT